MRRPARIGRGAPSLSTGGSTHDDIDPRQVLDGDDGVEAADDLAGDEEVEEEDRVEGQHVAVVPARHFDGLGVGCPAQQAKDREPRERDRPRAAQGTVTVTSISAVPRRHQASRTEQ